MIYNNLINLNCGHKACYACNVINTNEFCEICEIKECSFCHQLKKIVTPSCIHKQCEDCSIIIQEIGSCPECDRSELNFKCDSCLQFNITQNPPDCTIHNLCLNCQNKQPESCLLCSSKCFYCKEIKKVTFPTCMHPYCDICINENSPPCECVFCNNTSESFTCIQCNKVSLNIKRFNCSHNLCYECNRFEHCFICEKEETCPGCNKAAILKQRKCQHALCNKCLEQKYCIICNPEKFCKDCSNNYDKNSSNCKHGYCDSCRNNLLCKYCLCTDCNIKPYDKKLLCGHFLCMSCDQNDKCNQYIPKVCQLCNTKCTPEKYKCGHYFCNKCFKNVICLICNNIDYCKFCFTFTTKSKKFTCEHKACKICIKQGKCQECKCHECKVLKSLKIMDCGHKLCNDCGDNLIDKTCKDCFNSECQSCHNNTPSHKLKKNCNHIGCSACINYKYCINCKQNFYCNECKKITTDKQCEHLPCPYCNLDLKLCNCGCNNCHILDYLYSLNCGHIFCEKCMIFDTCKSCYEEKCDLCQRTNIKKYKNQCGHLICISCNNNKMCAGCNPQYFCWECLQYDINIEHCTLHQNCYNCIKRTCLCNKYQKNLKYAN